MKFVILQPEDYNKKNHLGIMHPIERTKSHLEKFCSFENSFTVEFAA